MERTCLIGKNREELEAFARSLGLEAYRGRQLFHWIYRKRATSFEEMTNLKKTLREELAKRADLTLLQLERVQESQVEPTRKFLFRLPDGLAVETVYMEDADRRTLCISSQVGCALRCDFCATGKMGFVRNLSAGEMVDQILWVERLLKTEITNVVVMGMGEPFLNYEEVLKAAEIISDPEGIAIGKRRITLSTSGIVPAIYRFVHEKRRFKLAISLNATTDAVRSQLMPINKKYPLEKLLEAVRFYAEHNHHRVTFEYVLIRGVNDSLEDALRLKKLLRGIPCKINIIPYNPIDGRYRAPTEEDLQRFVRPLLSMSAVITIRRSKGQDISAACGQLFTEVRKRETKKAALV